ncbi:salicylate hydroxylase-like protein [Apiosordaria backusii]|uniref:Salicylate hydroxylase-like protein n=1 Tax=Apiosordaria backusii TaxID=314023 RepID=A0AA40BJU2_9PEZI|nr:salicylate hydroxylase-like protein [Apiosordaria backusii]
MILSSTDEAKEAQRPETSPNTETQDEGLHLIVIGAGLAGLAAALSTKLANPNHKVTILEAVKELQEVGAGLQVTPNGTRLLSHWGLSPVLSPLAAVPTSLSVHRYDGTKLLAHEPNLQERMLSRYGHPFWDLHRVDLQREMVKKCLSLGITIRLNSRVTSIDFSTSTVTLGAVTNPTKRTLSGDLILLTDGLWSSLRPQFLGAPSPAILTGDLAYRITLHLPDLTGPDAPFLSSFITQPTVNFWIGPHSHCVGYSVSSSQTYNLVFLCPDDLPPETTKSSAPLSEFVSKFSNWDPLLQKFISQIKSVQKWKLMWLPPLPRWTSPQGNFFLAGDCCHPMLPYLAQGANSSLEDGAVFGHLLSKVSKSTSGEQLPKMAEMYEQLRMERGRRIQLETFKQRDDSHLPDGPEQEARDEIMTSQLGQEDVRPGFPSRWTDPEIQGFLYGYDAYGEAERAWKENPY